MHGFIGVMLQGNKGLTFHGLGAESGFMGGVQLVASLWLVRGAPRRSLNGGERPMVNVVSSEHQASAPW